MTNSAFAESVLAVKDFIADGEKLGITIPVHLKRKLDKVENQSQDGSNGRIKVALVGGFSVGKTSIVASWLGEHKANMKIGVGESSNEVEIYNPNDTYQIIDTPGLYGHKKEMDGAKEREAYKEKTRRYVSEAHVLLYVLDPVNPIKESHKDELNWLFRQLDLLPRTVFVLSRFDKIVDMGDEEEYKEGFATKKANIISRLKDLIGLTDAEAAALPVVAVSAAPDEKGVDEWLQSGDKEEYEALSHMQSLREAIDRKVEDAGGYEALTTGAHAAMLRDVLLQPLDIAKACGLRLKEGVSTLSDTVSLEDKLFEDVPPQIKSVSEKTLEDINEVFDHLRQDIRSSTMETLAEMLERRLGETGDRLNNEVKSIYDSQVEPLRRDVERRMAAITDMEPILRKYKADMAGGLELKGDYEVERIFQVAPWMTIVEKLTGFMGNEKVLQGLMGLLGKTNPVASAATVAQKTAEEAVKQAGKRFARTTTKKVAEEAVKHATWLGRVSTFLTVAGPLASMAIDMVKEQKEKAKQEQFVDWKKTVLKSLKESEQSVREQMVVTTFLKVNIPYWEQFVELANKHKAQLEEAQQELARYSSWLQQGEQLELHIQG